ncbi:hypothetical protein NHX12_002064 [Muraenolepis orangiensis]|uniref:Uncharacterized protein n=1 Tax=Muraenolepis orangiensis TaxID=630683 RepID=A0A9Q0IHU0_9TELE|nr:hypothetical protein NHX12_002064 [Muraenolepis orangiensis]
MNLLQNTTMHPQLRDEETLVIENAIRLAIDSIINVLYSVNGTRTREYELMLGERDKEITRLSSREKDFERELQLVRRQGCSCGLYTENDEHCSGFSDQLQNPDCGDPRPGCEDAEDEMAAAAAAAAGQCEMSFSLGLFDTSPSQVSTQSQDLVAPLPAIMPAFQQTPVSLTPEAIDTLEGRQELSNSPVIKEEPSDMDAICESSDLHSTGILENGEMVDFRGNLYPGPGRLGSHESEQLMMRASFGTAVSPWSVFGQLSRTPEETSRLPACTEEAADGATGDATPDLELTCTSRVATKRSLDAADGRQRLEPDEAQRLKREAWRAASRRYYARKMARLRAHRPPQMQLHPLGATASPCFMPASLAANPNNNNNNNNNSSISIINHHHNFNINNNNRKRRKRILELPEDTQSSQREAWRVASKRYYARRSTGLPPDHLDLAHFLQNTQPSGMNAPQS